MKRIVIMNCITIFLITVLSYVSTPNNQILSNHHLLIGFGSVIAFMSVLWIISLLIKDASIVDIFWGPAFVVLGCSLLISMDQIYSERSLSSCVNAIIHPPSPAPVILSLIHI